MKFLIICTFSVLVSVAQSQLPPRLNIPGAVLLTQARPAPFRTPRIHADPGLPPRLRGRPNIPTAPPSAPIRPVVEDNAEEAPSSATNSNFDDEVTKLGISALQSAVRQAAATEPEEEQPPQRQVHFRPERPVPVLRQDIRENVPQPPPQPRPIQRQEQRENIPRPLLRQEPKDDLPPIRQPIRHSQPRQQIAPQPQVVRQPTRVRQQQPSQHLDEDGVRVNHPRARKPPVQILRKYRTDNPDGSITWGFENEDGTFKDETLGVDCITRGNYGYIDPDGVRREYKYETGNKCDEPEEEEEDLPNRPSGPSPIQARKPQFRPQQI